MQPRDSDAPAADIDALPIHPGDLVLGEKGSRVLLAASLVMVLGIVALLTITT